MNETTKTKRLWGAAELALFRGTGIDIGCGPDPVFPHARRFDREDGDANVITRHVTATFDWVYSSHCLEHMHDPHAALQEWWRLVKPGGHLIFIVPDEDLYEQGVFPSRFNSDHKSTFTIHKAASWSPVSVNVRDLAAALPGGELVSLVVHDTGYDRSLQGRGPAAGAGPLLRFADRVYWALRRRGLPRCRAVDRFRFRYLGVDQTVELDVLAQIQCIVRKKV